MMEQYVSPAEFRRLLSALFVVLGFIVIAILFAFLIVPGQRYRAHTSDESAVMAVQGESGWLDATEYLPSRKREIPPVDPKAVMTPTVELLGRGKVLFNQTCATCHGPSGQGNGAAARGLNPPPRDLTTASGWKNGTSVEGVFRTLDQGVKGSAMVSYSYLSRKDRMALVHFVRSLGSFEHQASDQAARAELERSFSTVGELIPNRIPVSEAIRRLVGEYESPSLPTVCQGNETLGSALSNADRAAKTLSGLTAGRGDTATLADPIAFGAPENGFAPKVSTYSGMQWNQLTSCIASH